MRLDAVFPNRFHLIPKPWYRPKDVRSPSQIPRVKLLYWIHTPRGSPTCTDTHTHPRPTLLLIYSTLRSDRGFSAPTEGISLVWLITPHSDTEGLGQGHPSKAEMHAWETIPEEKQRKPKRTTRGRGTEMWALRSRKGNQAGTKARKIRRNKSCRVEWRERRVCFPLWVPRKNTFLLAMDQHRQKRGCKGDKLTSLRSSLEGKDPRSRIGSMDFLGGIVGKIPPANAGDTGSIPCPGRSHRPVEQPSLGTTTTEPKL